MRTIGARLLLAGAVAAAPSQQKPPAGTETRDRYLNPRETDLSLGLEVDPGEIPDIPPVEPGHALETFRIKTGFRLELVAHEPLVVDPIQLAFDEDGRLYVVELKDGSSVSGIMLNETQTSVTVPPPFGQPVVVPRANIVGIKSREQSMMPEGLEDGLSLQDMADLVQFIVGRQSP